MGNIKKVAIFLRETFAAVEVGIEVEILTKKNAERVAVGPRDTWGGNVNLQDSKRDYFSRNNIINCYQGKKRVNIAEKKTGKSFARLLIFPGKSLIKLKMGPSDHWFYITLCWTPETDLGHNLIKLKTGPIPFFDFIGKKKIYATRNSTSTFVTVPGRKKSAQFIFLNSKTLWLRAQK